MHNIYYVNDSNSCASNFLHGVKCFDEIRVGDNLAVNHNANDCYVLHIHMQLHVDT